MENRPVPLVELFGDAGFRLETEILSATATEDRISIVERFLLERLISAESIDKIAKECSELMLELNGQLSVNELSDQLKINRRRLERRFTSAIGLSPKQLSKIIRVQATLKMIANNQFTSLTAIAYEGNYYDQAHFIKDFKEFTGVSPKQFYVNNLKMSQLFLDAE
jgi:AraC-like DNA-binding protein